MHKCYILEITAACFLLKYFLLLFGMKALELNFVLQPWCHKKNNKFIAFVETFDLPTAAMIP